MTVVVGEAGSEREGIMATTVVGAVLKAAKTSINDAIVHLAIKRTNTVGHYVPENTPAELHRLIYLLLWRQHILSIGKKP